MKLSDRLYETVQQLWKEAAGKPFVREMAEGTLDPDCFRGYMLQDYLYLHDYIDILNTALECTDDSRLQEFLRRVIEETRNETERVHLPNMKKIGVSDQAIRNCKKADIIVSYVDYMKQQFKVQGIIAGLTALLQCSWVYAYIGETLMEEYADRIAVSPYKSWFDSYTCREYTEANRRWIDVLDRETEDISPEEVQELCAIFKQCAEYENHFWDMLYNKR